MISCSLSWMFVLSCLSIYKACAGVDLKSSKILLHEKEYLCSENVHLSQSFICFFIYRTYLMAGYDINFVMLCK